MSRVSVEWDGPTWKRITLDGEIVATYGMAGTEPLKLQIRVDTPKAFVAMLEKATGGACHFEVTGEIRPGAGLK